MFNALRKRIAQVEAAPAQVAVASAARIQETLRADSTTERGNVPSYGKFGDVSSTATGNASAVTVRAADWVMNKARELEQPKKWLGIVQDEARAAFAGGAK